MSIVLICLLIATIMPILVKAPLAYAMNKEGGYDNRHPRAQQNNLKGFGARAKAAHENCFEALMMFTPGALACVATQTTGSTVEYLAMGFIAARVLYVLCYWFNIHMLRSTIWLVGFGCSVAMLWLAI